MEQISGIGALHVEFSGGHGAEIGLNSLGFRSDWSYKQLYTPSRHTLMAETDADRSRLFLRGFRPLILG
jgi:hypothetical protein